MKGAFVAKSATNSAFTSRLGRLPPWHPTTIHGRHPSPTRPDVALRRHGRAGGARDPLAGERLWFRCRVTDVRPATADEIRHGHAHGEHAPEDEAQDVDDDRR